MITTVAGNGTYGFSGDGGPAINAQLARPNSVAVDRAGNLFILDTYNYRIRKVSADGIITTVAGNPLASPLGSFNCSYSGDGGPATNAQLTLPGGAVVSAGGIFTFSANPNHPVRPRHTKTPPPTTPSPPAT